MHKKNNSNVQEEFINHLISKELVVKLFIVTGVKLEGLISSHDDNCITIKNGGHSILVYKQAIATITPYENVRLEK